jgi:benzoylformate decarboxylase
MLLLGGVGPIDAMKRRPWVDWIHTSRDLGALLRGYTKWDDLPGSVPAALEAILRAYRIAMDAAAGTDLRGARRHAAGRSARGAGAAADLDRYRAAAPGAPPTTVVREWRKRSRRKRPL